MGLYLEVPDKLDFLLKNKDKEIQQPNISDEICNDEGRICCIVANPAFIAIAAMTDARELAAWLNPLDNRSKAWLRLDEAFLKANCPDWPSYEDYLEY